MKRQDYIEWLVKVATKLHKGTVFTGGLLTGKNIVDHYNSLTLVQLRKEYNSYHGG